MRARVRCICVRKVDALNEAGPVVVGEYTTPCLVRGRVGNHLPFNGNIDPVLICRFAKRLPSKYGLDLSVTSEAGSAFHIED